MKTQNSVSLTACPTPTTPPSTDGSRRPSPPSSQSMRHTRLSTTSPSSQASSTRPIGPISSLTETQSTPTRTSSRLWPNSPPSAARQTSRDRALRRPASASFPPSSHTGRRRQGRERGSQTAGGPKVSNFCSRLVVPMVLAICLTVLSWLGGGTISISHHSQSNSTTGGVRSS